MKQGTFVPCFLSPARSSPLHGRRLFLRCGQALPEPSQKPAGDLGTSNASVHTLAGNLTSSSTLRDCVRLVHLTSPCALEELHTKKSVRRTESAARNLLLEGTLSWVPFSRPQPNPKSGCGLALTGEGASARLSSHFLKKFFKIFPRNSSRSCSFQLPAA